MREEQSRRHGRPGDGASGTIGRRLVVVLGVVAVVMVALVVYREWPAWIADAGHELLEGLLSRVGRSWTEIGGRWFTLGATVAAVAVGALVSRRHRTLGVVIMEAAIAIGAVAVLLQPAGW